MDFNLSFEAQVPREAIAGLTVTMRSEKGGAPFEIPVGEPGLGIFQVPDELVAAGTSLLVGLRAMFRKMPQVVAEAAVRLPNGASLRGMRIDQPEPEYVRAQIGHREPFGVTMIDQCTVFCPGTGESRSGRNVCIECKGSRGIVRICC